jgi:hypothetical protein
MKLGFAATRRLRHILPLFASTVILGSGVVSCSSQSPDPGVRVGGTSTNTMRVARHVAAIPTGLYAMVDASSLSHRHRYAGVVAALAHPYIHGISLMVGWSDLAPSPTTPYGDPQVVGSLLHLLDTAEQRAGRSHLPVFLKFYPDDLPDWLRTLPIATRPTPRTNTLGMKVLALPSDDANYGSATDVPYSVDPVYQAAVQRLMHTIDRGLAMSDPTAHQIVALSFIAPFMLSNEMGTPLPANAIFRDRGTDPYWHLWTRHGHIAAIAHFAKVMASESQFATRVWVFNFVTSTIISTADQVPVFRAVESAHPAGQAAVLAKTENLTANFTNATGTAVTGSWRSRYLTDPWAPLNFVAHHHYHEWEMWLPFTGTTRYAGPHLALPPTLWRQVEQNSLALDLTTPDSSPQQGTLFVEIWSRDLIRPTPTLDRFLNHWDAAIRTEAGK